MRWRSIISSSGLLLTICFCAGCGSVAEVPTSTATSLPPTATPVPSTPTLTATPPAGAGSTCQPDPYGIYSGSGYVTQLTDAPLPAPPETKHGIGSSGTNSGVTQGGKSGVCTIGTNASIAAFYSAQLPSR